MFRNSLFLNSLGMTTKGTFFVSFKSFRKDLKKLVGKKCPEIGKIRIDDFWKIDHTDCFALYQII